MSWILRVRSSVGRDSLQAFKGSVCVARVILSLICRLVLRVRTRRSFAHKLQLSSVVGAPGPQYKSQGFTGALKTSFGSWPHSAGIIRKHQKTTSQIHGWVQVYHVSYIIYPSIIIRRPTARQGTISWYVRLIIPFELQSRLSFQESWLCSFDSFICPHPYFDPLCLTGIFLDRWLQPWLGSSCPSLFDLWLHLGFSKRLTSIFSWQCIVKSIKRNMPHDHQKRAGLWSKMPTKPRVAETLLPEDTWLSPESRFPKIVAGWLNAIVANTLDRADFHILPPKTSDWST